MNQQKVGAAPDQMHGPPGQSGPPPPYAPGPGGPQMMQQQQQMAPMGGVAVVSMQPMMMAPPMMSTGMVYSSAPAVMQCPYCREQIVTMVTNEAGACAYLSAVICCVVGCWLGCCLIPLFMRETQDAVHSCPRCRQYIGTYQRI